jgi:hypothetical protein
LGGLGYFVVGSCKVCVSTFIVNSKERTEILGKL